RSMRRLLLAGSGHRKEVIPQRLTVDQSEGHSGNTQVLEKHHWDKGKASRSLFKHRERLTRPVHRLFERFPSPRGEKEFETLASKFRRRSDDRPSRRAVGS